MQIVLLLIAIYIVLHALIGHFMQQRGIQQGWVSYQQSSGYPNFRDDKK